VADFLDAKVKEIEARLRELQPLIEEYHRLEAAASALEHVDGGGGGGGGLARPAPRRNVNGSRRGRPRGSRGGNTRATQAVELVRLHPGISIPDLAGHMGIKPNYLYRILPQLEDEGKVRRRDKGWHPV
jgi:hypothetical protein